MFCTSLRRRSSFVASISSLTSHTSLDLKGKSGITTVSYQALIICEESELRTHDIEIPLAHHPSPASINSKGPQRRLQRYLLLSPNSVSDKKINETLARITRFASLTGGVNVAIVMLLSAPPAITTAKHLANPPIDENDNTDGVHAYARLQAEIFSLVDLPYIPILPLASISGLADLLKSYTETVGTPPRTTTIEKDHVATSQLLEYCTTAPPPLPPLAIDLITDIFPSLAALATEALALRTFGEEERNRNMGCALPSSSDTRSLRGDLQPGLELLRDQLGEEVVRGLVEFWEEEWAID